MATELLAPIVAGLVAGGIQKGARGASNAIAHATTPNPQRQARRQARKAKRATTRRQKVKSHQVRAPTAIGTIATTSPPKVGSNRAGSPLPVTHREYIYNVESSQAFNTWTFPLQPGDPTTFPWLRRMASLYERYRMCRCFFGYEPCCASTTVGSIVLCPDYDAEDAAPTSFLQATSNVAAVHGQAWSPLQCIIDPRKVHGSFQRLYTRTGNAGTDLKTYDGGNLNLGVSDFADDGTLVGRLFVDYTLELHTPQGAGSEILCSVAVFAEALSASTLIGDLTDESDWREGTLAFDYDGTNYTWPGHGEFWLTGSLTGTDLVGSFDFVTNGGGTWTELFSTGTTTRKSICCACRVEAGDIFSPKITSATTVTQADWTFVSSDFKTMADFT